MPAKPSIDVVIPVYNAPALTRHCIDSVVASLNESVRHIYVQDDASDIETRVMLDQLPYEHVHVHHAQKNQGFGASVNEAVSRSDASFVLILNSDTTASEDFLQPLFAAMAADPQLAVVIPAGNDYARDNLAQCMREPGGYIRTHRLRGHAFLIRRHVFHEIGGFDPAFGRGYYEDIDLGRRLDLRGWRLGVHPDARIQHAGGGSFGRGRSYKALVKRNRSLYFARYPNASLNVLLLSANCPLTHFPPDLLDALDHVFREGGYVYWVTSDRTPPLLCLQMRSYAMGLEVVARLLLRSWRKEKRISEIWMLPGTSRLLRMLIMPWARVCGLKVLSWEWAVATQGSAPKLLSK
jgi:GT2 family glycosyltransferase